ncbi:ABC transporter ATP-binding protein [Pseudoduganella chitinolytica]|uniref:ABC transporter ATP-binding protein n=1 Tax=Pseudoduganella chitinolytica TaxID=34070 RepID=A0ABY8BD03_9BURK|nr:ABC transporter ATP-binding protein [Pseudoduganella chitinolytica]WEF33700.1 ABC transporter ATP-binding protein [Pseudoduganella chitinolytica]
MPTQPPLSMSRVVRRFGARTALDGLSLTLHAGDVFALLAPNGAGKTTTLNLILGFLPVHDGTIAVCGAPAGSAKARQAVAYLPEQVAVYPELSGVENLRYFALLAGLAPDDAALRRLLVQAGLDAAAHDRAARHYSKGMRQKVGIAIALARQARLLLLDEPTSGLDPQAAAELSAAIRAAARRGVAVLMVTHDLYHIREVATRVGFLRGGRIVREVDPRTADHADLERLYIGEMAQ